MKGRNTMNSASACKNKFKSRKIGKYNYFFLISSSFGIIKSY